SGDFFGVNYHCFAGGQLNASYNCLDRHLPTRRTKTAIIWAKDEPGDYEHLSYQKVFEEVCRLSNLLRAHGVKKGDRVCIYLPMIPELVYSLLACARIGAIHSVVFGGFSSDALRGRIEDGQIEFVITANEAVRGHKVIPLKKITDDAIKGLDFVRNVLVVNRTKNSVNMVEGRDLVYED